MLTKMEKEQVLNEKVDYIRKLINIFTVSNGTNRVNFDRDDIMQMAVISVYKALDVYDPDKGVGMDTYISTVVKNMVTDYKRKFMRYNAHIVPMSDFEDSDRKKDEFSLQKNVAALPDDSLDAAERKADFEYLIMKLQNMRQSKKNFERYGSVALLNNANGISYKETAERLDVPMNKLRACVSQLRKKLMEDPEILELVQSCA